MKNYNSANNRTTFKKGFTLLEVMVVVAILGLLAAIVVTRVTAQAEEAKKDATKIQIKEISKALELYKLDNGFYPTTDQGLKALMTQPETDPRPKKWKQYIESMPKDAWGNDFIYIQPGSHSAYDLFSYGPDGVEGGEDDIVNWQKDENK